MPEHLLDSKDILFCNKYIFELKRNIKAIGPKLKQDVEVAQRLIKYNVYCYASLDQKILLNRELSLKAIEKQPRIISQLPEEIKEDLKIVLFALNLETRVYEDLSDSLRDNDQVIYKALSKKENDILTTTYLLKLLPERLQHLVNINEPNLSLEAILLHLELNSEENKKQIKQKINKI